MFVYKYLKTTKFLRKSILIRLFYWIVALSLLITVSAYTAYAVHYKKPIIMSSVNSIVNYIDKNVVIAYRRYYKEFEVLSDSNDVKFVDLNLNIKRKCDYKMDQEKIAVLNSKKRYISSDQLSQECKATIESSASQVDAKIQLKGDNISHLSGLSPFPSIRVKIKNDNSIHGVHYFDVSHPSNRSYHFDYLVRDQVKKYGIIVPELFFARYSKNNKYQGIALIEEIFTSSVSDKYRRKEGISLKFNDNYYTDALSNNHDYTLNIKRYTHEFKTQEIAAVDKKAALKNHDIWLKATSLMRSYQNGLLTTSDVFDVDKLVLFLALSELWGSHHNVRLHNVRFYFNPVESKFELWWWDAVPKCEPSLSLNIMLSTFVQKVLEEQDIYLKFLSKLNDVSSDMQNISTKSSLLQLESQFNASSFPIDCLINRASIIQSAIKDSSSPSDLFIDGHSQEKVYPQPIRSAIIMEEDKVYIEFSNSSVKEVIVNDMIVTYKDKSGVNKNININFSEVNLPAHKPNTPLIWRKKYIGLLENILFSTVKVKGKSKIVDLDYEYLFEAKPMGALSNTKHNKLDELATIVKDYPFIKVKDDIITVIKGDWKIDKFLKFPNGYNIEIEPGVTLRFSKSSGILVNGGLKILGSLDNEVNFTSVDGISPWSGIVILSDKSDVIINSLIVDNVNGNYTNKSWSGGVIVNNARVDINKLTIKNSTAEDALNIISSSFSIDGLEVSNSYSDALDIDYSNGKIISSTFSNTGGDAVDISNTYLMVENISINGAFDKGFSIGEESTLEANYIDVSDASVGVAVKDSSRAVIKNANFNDIREVAVFAYNKKDRFKGGSVILNNPLFENTKKSFLSQNGSSIFIDKVEVLSEEVDISELYEFGYMKKTR